MIHYLTNKVMPGKATYKWICQIYCLQTSNILQTISFHVIIGTHPLGLEHSIS